MMKSIFSAENLHHAYFISGDRNEVKKEVFLFIESSLGILIKANPDVVFREYETFGIDDARWFKERQEKSAFGGGKKIFVIAFNFITTEAQNALLKVFEEPTDNTVFFTIAPSSAILLPTLRSRLLIISLPNSETPLSKEAEKFLRADIDSRLKMAEKFKDAENETKKSELLAFISQIEISLKKKNSDISDLSPDYLSSIDELIKLKRYLFGPSPKTAMIAEYLALRLPQAK